MEDEILKKITDFGDEAHGEQLRKYTPDRYMVHPKRVMEKCRSFTRDISVLAAALLHDVLEDTPITADEIKKFLTPLIGTEKTDKAISLIIELTDVYIKENYPKLNRKARKSLEVDRLKKISPEAQSIKYADILDNSLEISEDDPSFACVYLRESKTILENLNRGNAALHKEAMDTVNEKLHLLNKK